MRVLLFHLFVIAACSPASAQLVDKSRVPVVNARDVPNDIDLENPLAFKEFSIFFDGGSYGAKFSSAAKTRIMLFFPHYGYWSDDARRELLQPVVILHRRGGSEIWIEIEPKSKLNALVLNMIDTNLAGGGLERPQRATLKRVRACVANRKPLKEISDRIHRFKPRPKDGG